jgi:hypothetical protein
VRTLSIINLFETQHKDGYWDFVSTNSFKAVSVSGILDDAMTPELVHTITKRESVPKEEVDGRQIFSTLVVLSVLRSRICPPDAQ